MGWICDVVADVVDELVVDEVVVVDEVLVVGVVTTLVGTNLPTTIVTALPCLAFAPPRGDWLITTPFCDWLLTVCVSRVTVKPAPVNALFAAEVD